MSRKYQCHAPEDKKRRPDDTRVSHDAVLGQHFACSDGWDSLVDRRREQTILRALNVQGPCSLSQIHRHQKIRHHPFFAFISHPRPAPLYFTCFFRPPPTAHPFSCLTASALLFHIAGLRQAEAAA